MDETGHLRRPNDLEAIAGLGIRTLRFPVLMEAISPDSPQQCDWRWHDHALDKLRRLGIAPIAGLIHHGSGPRYTDLLDPGFGAQVALHAGRVARRYPWIKRFTPVNEPLTTARFSGLYGHWYPHTQDTASFLRCLYNQCNATWLSMRAIREVIPDAELVQTEDLGKVFSTPLLQYQAVYENQRRWLSLDLLCGRIDRSHDWYQAFLDAGLDQAAMDVFTRSPCVPDIVGINHYLTSERFLDENVAHYPAHHAAGNGRHCYADVEAVRIAGLDGEVGPGERLREAWERYRLPLAVTEVHHGCTRDEQVRWLLQVWRAAQQLREEGVDMRAVTVWALLGAMDWSSLLVQRNGAYEPGAFDVRDDSLRLTALGQATRALALDGDYDHPVLQREGWWRRDSRHYRPHAPALALAPGRPPQQLAITGRTGTLGRAFSTICEQRGLDHVLLGRSGMDIADPDSVEAALDAHRPWAVINTAGFVRVAEAASNAERCYRENASGAEILARACARRGIPMVTFSSDLVFNGQLGRAYMESDEPSPTCVYGNSKAEAERRVLQAWDQALVVRTSAFFGPWDSYNFVHAVLRELAAGRRFEASDNLHVSPTYVPDLVHASLDLLIDQASGIWHLANRGLLSWHELADRAAAEAGLQRSLLARCAQAAPRVTALSSERGLMLPPIEHALSRFIRECTVPWHTGQAQQRAAIRGAM
ncbi:sugar nucleotide-binding protein [Lacisediminimonas sp.]|uniref:sugar nucleotide-binding protein n=1 Tax=Lacisediminimonas sp. TaxID=3060582 RepID=UPI002724263E|nr:sugar nucleotide-binding protein [Lacisediminimonas sp.]MDO8300865.1 sugar nucleotide-binding protein [Lacisediminimonas sp.]